MTFENEQFGLPKQEIAQIISDELEKNADILVGIDDPEVNEMIKILIVGISKAIVENNSLLESATKNYMSEHSRRGRQF